MTILASQNFGFACFDLWVSGSGNPMKVVASGCLLMMMFLKIFLNAWGLLNRDFKFILAI